MFNKCINDVYILFYILGKILQIKMLNMERTFNNVWGHDSRH